MKEGSARRFLLNKTGAYVHRLRPEQSLATPLRRLEK
jgi:hypothetical protein